MNETMKHAIRVLRARVQYRTAALKLPGSDHGNYLDSGIIRDATRLYVQTWILPILDAMEQGDTRLVRDLTARVTGEEIAP